MVSLSPIQRRQRLTFDYRITQSIHSPLVKITAFRSAADLQGKRLAITSVEEGGKATHYLLDCRIKSLVGRGKHHDRFAISVDLLAGGNYPFTKPVSDVISEPRPWSPHFTKGAPICVGEFWEQQKGHATLGHLIIHLLKLLNFDEPPREQSYGGYNADAAAYWRDVLHHQPITPRLKYPVISRKNLEPDEETASKAAFRALTKSPPSGLFKPAM